MTNTSQSLEELMEESNKEWKEQGMGMSEEELKEILKSRGLVSFMPVTFSKELREKMKQQEPKE